MVVATVQRYARATISKSPAPIPKTAVAAVPRMAAEPQTAATPSEKAAFFAKTKTKTALTPAVASNHYSWGVTNAFTNSGSWFGARCEVHNNFLNFHHLFIVQLFCF